MRSLHPGPREGLLRLVPYMCVLDILFMPLYRLPKKSQMDYFKIKAMELLVYLEGVDFEDAGTSKPYFYRTQVEKIHAVHDLITSDLRASHTQEVEIFTLGSAAFVAEKPEVNCQTEWDLKARSPYTHTCLLCMVNGEMKYMPDRLAYERNTFEAQSSILLPGAAERFVEEVSDVLNKLYGEQS